MSSVGNLESVGVFHFGDPDQSCPLSSLECQLQKRETGLVNSLIVLPEAFNIPHGYYGGIGPTPSMKEKLLALSERYGVVFVAGLIEEKAAAGFSEGFNSAYLIDAACEDKFTLLSQKRRDCRDPICSANPDGSSKPVIHRGVGIAALICNDFINCDEDTRNALIEHVEWTGSRTRILCVPSCSTWIKILITKSEAWKQQLCVAAANGHPHDLSFVRGKGFQETRLLADERTGSVLADGNYDDRCGYAYNEILLSNPMPSQ